MISRRALLGTGAAVVVVGAAGWGAERAGRLDDLAREVGLEPTRASAEADEDVLATVRAEQASLVTFATTLAGRATLADAVDPIASVLREQLSALGSGRTGSAASATPPDDDADALEELSRRARAAADARADDAVAVVSQPFAVLLASMSAGLSQVADAARSAR